MDTFFWVCHMGWTLGFRQMVYSLGMFPIVSKDLQNAFIIYRMSWVASVVGGVVGWSCEGVIFWAGLGHVPVVCCYAGACWLGVALCCQWRS